MTPAEQLAIELDQAKDLVRVLANHVNRLEKALSDATQYAEEQAKVINENKQTIKELRLKLSEHYEGYDI